MSDLTTYLRYVTSGLAFSHSFLFVCPKPLLDLIYSSEKNLVIFATIIAPFVGLVYESWTRDHPCGEDVIQIYRYIRNLIQSRFSQLKSNILEYSIDPVSTRTQPLTNESLFFSTLSKSIYEAFVWTFPGTSTYMKRVDQQIRIGYFYLNLYRSLILFACFYLLAIYTRVAVKMYGDSTLISFVDSYLLPWMPMDLLSITSVVIISFVLVIICVCVGMHLRQTAQAIIEVELDSRLAILKKYQSELEELIDSVVIDPHMLVLFHEKASRRHLNRKYGQYWKLLKEVGIIHGIRKD